MRFGSVSGRRLLLAIGLVSLLALFALQLANTASRESQTYDEGIHIFAGYNY
jgi:hypothetical protein